MTQLTSYKGRTVENNEKVACFWNLHQDVFSLQGTRVEGEKRKTLTLSHGNNIILKNAKFVVRKSGREKVLKEQRKNVHAFIKGDIEIGEVSIDLSKFKHEFRQAYYNPYKTSSFVDKETMQEIKTAKLVYLIDKQVYYMN